MEKERKLNCYCGGEYSLKTVHVDGIALQGYVCNKCKEMMFSEEQSKKYIELMRMKEATEKERKIIRIGSSMGITLPDMLKKFGVKVGRKVKLEAIDKKSIKITLI